MNNSKAKRRALQLLDPIAGQLTEVLRELELVQDPDMKLDDAHSFIRRAKQAVEQAQVSIQGSLG